MASGAMLPSLLGLFALPESSVWRLSSALVAGPTLCFALVYPTRRRAASAARTPWRIWVDVAILLTAAGALVADALGVASPPCAATFAASLTAILCVSGWAYLQALDILLRQHWARRTK